MAINLHNIKKLQIGLASPEQILKWARGTEITSSETINYKTAKPEENGLFCEKIFGPVKDFECACGKYKKVKYRGKVCEKCGVEIIESIVRSERMSCIKLAYPCTHIWMSKEFPNPSKISQLLDISYKNVEQVIYFVNYIVVKNDNEKFKDFFQTKEVIPIAADQKTNMMARKKIANALWIIKKNLEKKIANDKQDKSFANLKQDLEEISQYLATIENQNLAFETKYIFSLITKYTGIEIEIGSLAIKHLLQAINLQNEAKNITRQLKRVSPATLKFKKLMSRLEIIKWFINSKIKPEWMVLDVIPVTPPETRPIVQLENGRFTTSDINTFYRKIIIRNQRLKRLTNEQTPQIILDNERRMLQEAVDALFDNSSRTKSTISKDKRVLKSLTDCLKGKQGLFRQNLLGKRVDYSGRSVIVVGPDLKMYQVGIPAPMLLQLFKPFIIHELITKYDENGIEKTPIANTVKRAEKLILQQDDVIWPIVEKIIKKHPVLLNRAPTLHRLSIQAFEPKIIDGKAIRLHPLVTTAFNADFDGDQMGVYVPLSQEAIAEARSILLASWHILGPKDGKPIITPTQDMILGVYYLSKVKKNTVGEGIILSSITQAKQLLNLKCVTLHTLVGISTNCYHDKGLPKDCLLITTIGKIIFNEIMPKTMPYINHIDLLPPSLDNGDIVKTNCNFADVINRYKPSIPFVKKTLQKIVDFLYEKFPIEVVAKTMDLIKNIGFEYSTKSAISFSAFDLPIYSKKYEFFQEADKKVIALKKQFDKGLLTDDERYSKTIKLWSGVKDKVMHDIENIINDEKYRDNSVITMANSGARGNVSQFTQVLGMRGLMSKSYNYDQKTKSNVIKDIIETPIKHNFLEGLTISEYFNSSYGARKGMADTAMKTSKSGYMTRKLVDAAQEIIVKEEDCHTTKGLLVEAIVDQKQNFKIESLAERIANRYAFADIIHPNNKTILVAKNQIITTEMANKIEKLGIKQVMIRSVLHCKCKNGVCQKCFGNDLATKKLVEIGTAIGVIAAQSIGEPGTQLTMRTFHTGGAAGEGNIAQGFERLKQLFDMVPPQKNQLATISEVKGKVVKIAKNEFGKMISIKCSTVNEIISYQIGLQEIICVQVGDEVNFGDRLTYGAINMKQLLKTAGITAVRQYLIDEIQKVYRIQGIEISDKYIEIIIRQLTNKLKINNPNGSNFFIGEIVDENTFIKECDRLIASGKVDILPTANNVIYGLENIATTKSGSFLAAASFQDTKKILTDAAVKGEFDNLIGLKENVMIGNILPIGTGLMTSEEIIAKGEEMHKKEY